MRNKLSFFTFCLILFVVLSGCSAKKKEISDRDKDKPILTVMHMAEDSAPYVKLQFANIHPEIKIKELYYASGDPGGNKIKAITDIMSGEGPDILMIRAQEFPGLHKILKNDVFYDLDVLMEKDKDFNLGDYYPAVMDTGIYAGKRVLLPLEFNLPLMITSKTFLSENSIDISNKGTTWGELYQIAKSFKEKEGNKDKYIFSYDFKFEEMVCASYNDFIDYGKNESYFDSEEFITLLKMYKQVQDCVFTPKAYENFNSFDQMEKGKIGIYKLDRTDFLIHANAIMEQRMGEEIQMLPYPAYKGQGGVTATVKSVAAININCDKPQAAFDFLKLLLTDRNQNQQSRSLNPYSANFYVWGTPVNIKAAQKWLERDTRKGYISTGQGGEYINVAVLYPLTDRIVTKANGFLERINNAYIYDQTILDIIRAESKDFRLGKASAEETARNINNKVILYLNE